MKLDLHSLSRAHTHTHTHTRTRTHTHTHRSRLCRYTSTSVYWVAEAYCIHFREGNSLLLPWYCHIHQAQHCHKLSCLEASEVAMTKSPELDGRTEIPVQFTASCDGHWDIIYLLCFVLYFEHQTVLISDKRSMT